MINRQTWWRENQDISFRLGQIVSVDPWRRYSRHTINPQPSFSTEQRGFSSPDRETILCRSCSTNEQHLLNADSELMPENPLSRRKEKEKLTIDTVVWVMISQLGSSGDIYKSYKTTRNDRRRSKERRECRAVQVPVAYDTFHRWSIMMVDWMFIEIDEQRCNASRLLITCRWRTDGNFRSMSSGHMLEDRVRIGDTAL